MRKRVAVIVAQVDEATQKRFLTDFIRQLYTFDYDVCIFTMHQKYQETPLRDISDSNIYNLINFKLFDAVVILADTIITPGLAPILQDRVKENFDGPVLVIDQTSKHFETVMMDHYTPVRQIIDHLIEVHGYTEIAFLSGKQGHPHSIQRLNAFMDSMKAHNLPVREEWIFHGNYWYESADEFSEILLKNRDHLPQVVACANDIMAIGVATNLTEAGYRIPEDIAITGYDSVADGRHSPAPLTSAEIPADECGRYTALRIHSMMTGESMPEFSTNAKMFIGASCGCDHKVELVPKKIRPVWRTVQSSSSMFSDFNHMIEDLLAQSGIKDFLQTVQRYTYQIRPFHSFDICLNEGFLSPDSFLGNNALRTGYTDTVYRVLSEGSSKGDSSLDLERSFRSCDLIPDLYEERDYPTTFVFNPLYFDDRCFGYTVLNYGKEVDLYNTEFRLWMRDVMQGLEAFYRQEFMLSLIKRIESSQIRDSLTGLYNYEGFIQETRKLTPPSMYEQTRLTILTIDIKGIRQMNDVYGRDIGNKAIKAVARFLQNSVHDDEICCRMCNDEFLVSLYDNDRSSGVSRIVEAVNNRLKDFRLVDESDYGLQIHHASLQTEDVKKLEATVNQVISIKNYSKTNSGPKKTEQQDLIDELKRNQEVMHILDKNLLTYHYQPIVDVSDSSIYAYEALMRSSEGSMSPYHIIQSATYLNRLYDVEKYTLLNVTSDFDERNSMFGDSKIFINSLPGINLTDEDRHIFATMTAKNKNRFVIEFTEESELTDEQLSMLKKSYEELGIGIAIDDYGAGYSNAGNLLRYTPNYVKIDRVLITEIQNNPQKQHFVRHIIDYAHENNILALAEGVETREELQECINLGIDLIQGYYTGKPARDPIGELPDDIKSEIESFRQMNRGWNMVHNIL